MLGQSTAAISDRPTSPNATAPSSRLTTAGRPGRAKPDYIETEARQVQPSKGSQISSIVVTPGAAKVCANRPRCGV
ncbi:hypothetical protein TsFJ059_009058 [Trichoderma semiorbis]|uniref:Uncharacterized protein n=1 Tax=Trichoderma semiorbis TaxID=1491008 RepID=A0A9P8KRX0_9HYPO|nr:hypothetical protein TsFJ059_009058 [Trichoderma semiorbis]